MVKKIILYILSALMGAVFIYSAYAKLDPIEPFEFTFVDLGVASWRMAPFMARFFISLELFIGILFVLNIQIKAACKISAITLILFSVYLLGLMFIVGNKGNCGCFGNKLIMTPLQALIKNGIMLGLLFPLYKYHQGITFKWTRYMMYFVLVASLAMPHILNYVDWDYSQVYLTKKEDYYKLELDTLYKHATMHTPPKTLSQGKHIITFMSLTCPHCRIAAKKMKIMKDKDKDLPIYFVLNGDSVKLSPFFEDTKATNIPWCMLKGKAFVYLGGLNLPDICLINNSMVENEVDYIHLDQTEVEKWLKK